MSECSNPLSAFAAFLRDYGVHAFLAVTMSVASYLYREVRKKDSRILELAMKSQLARLKTAEVLRNVKDALVAIERKLPDEQGP